MKIISLKESEAVSGGQHIFLMDKKTGYPQSISIANKSAQCQTELQHFAKMYNKAMYMVRECAANGISSRQCPGIDAASAEVPKEPFDNPDYCPDLY